MTENCAMDRRVLGAVIGVASAAAVGGLLLPARPHLSIATAALVLVIPVVAGVTIGGFLAGLASVAAGFLVYDLWFIPPYGTLTVGKPQNWVALVVYVIVMVFVARLVTHLHAAEAAARSRTAVARHLLAVSELLLSDRDDLAGAVTETVRDAFGIESVAIVEDVAGRLEVIAAAGPEIAPSELARLRPEAHLPVPLSTAHSQGILQTLALVSSGRPVGLLVLRGVPTERAVREALPVLANDLAVALERQELATRAHRAELLEEVDRLRQALVSAVSHDLRTPLATIKIAASTLGDASMPPSPEDQRELAELIEGQTDRLERLVANLLDMTRIQSGSLEVRREPVRVLDLIDEARAALGGELAARVVRTEGTELETVVEVDPVLVTQVLANLLDNAERHSPPGRVITVTAERHPSEQVAIAVADAGEGVAGPDREAVFERFVRFDTGQRSGLGLAIARAFVEAHGGRIWVEDAPGGGARFVFTVPRADLAARGVA
jgi:two-component system, OmpR family, sensor histidine kinase KdpD